MDVLLPRTLPEALDMRSATPEALPIAGGTDLMVEINFDRRRPEVVMDVSRLPELHAWRDEDGSLFLGAGVTFTQIIRELPQLRALAEASRSVGSPQIRNRGTLGGNLGTGSPAGDALPVLAAYDARIGVASAERGERWLAWDEFLLGVKQTALGPDELITGARFSPVSGPQSFSKIGTRNAMVIAVANLCFAMDQGTRTVRVALGSVAPTVVRARDAEAFLGAELERAGAWDDLSATLPPEAGDGFAERVQAAASPIDDVRGTAAYRRHTLGVLARRAVGWAMVQRAEEAMLS